MTAEKTIEEIAIDVFVKHLGDDAVYFQLKSAMINAMLDFEQQQNAALIAENDKYKSVLNKIATEMCDGQQIASEALTTK